MMAGTEATWSPAGDRMPGATIGGAIALWLGEDGRMHGFKAFDASSGAA